MGNRGEAILGGAKKKGGRTLYIACEEMDFYWTVSELMHFRYMWNQGKSITDIASYFNRDPDEVGILIIDQARQNLIKPRKGGLE